MKSLDFFIAEDLLAWKRMVQGVREMCDVCQTNLFNFHWSCGRCGFVVCAECYSQRVNNSTSGTSKRDPGGNSEDGNSSSGENRDEHGWLECTSGTAHQPQKLILTQIITGDTLQTLNANLKAVTSGQGQSTKGGTSEELSNDSAGGKTASMDNNDQTRKTSLRDFIDGGGGLSQTKPDAKCQDNVRITDVIRKIDIAEAAEDELALLKSEDAEGKGEKGTGKDQDEDYKPLQHFVRQSDIISGLAVHIIISLCFSR